VEITKPFYLGKYEVTRGQFRRFVEDARYRTDAEEWKKGSGTDEHPVLYVNWTDARLFCDWLSSKEGKKYRLPTEAEWEYSCRAGSRTRFGFGNDDKDLAQFAWYNANSEVKAHPVGQKKPNAWGLFDMHGNALEWCEDQYDETDYYYRVARGGAFFYTPRFCRAASRFMELRGHRSGILGFRVVCER
jgi:formylglycine-generating enzyme required for sulfatase activity